MDRDRLLQDNIPLAYYIARRFLTRNRRLPAEDMTQAALIGLWKAAQKFDPGRGTQFSTFAGLFIMGELNKTCRLYRDDWRLLDLEPQLKVGRYHDRVLDPEEAALSKVELRTVLARIAGLPERERRVLQMRVAGRTEIDIGRAVGCGQTHASRLLKRARKELREAIA